MKYEYLKYMIIVDREECLDVVKDYMNHRIGWSRVYSECKRLMKIPLEYRVAITVVHAPREYQSIIAGTRMKSISVKVSTILSIKIPIWLHRKLDEYARKLGVNKSEIVRRAIVEYLEKLERGEQCHSGR